MSPRAAKGENTPSRDEVILAAAAELFRQRGFADVGVDEIGKAAGVSGPAIYRHFDSKDAILAALFDEALDELLLRTGGTRDDPADEIRFLAFEHVGYIVDNPRVAAIWIHEGRSLTEAHRKRFSRRTDTYEARWSDALRRCYPGISKDQARAAARGSIGALNSVMDWPRDLKTPEQVDFLCELVVHGLRALEDSAPASNVA